MQLPSSFTCLLLLTAMACGNHPQQKESTTVAANMAIGTYTGTGSYGIYLANFDDASGQLTIVDSIAAENPSFLAYNHGWKTIYGLQENGGDKAGRIGLWQWQDSSKKYEPVTDKLSGGDHPCYVSVIPEHRLVTLANYTGGSVSVLPLSDNGLPSGEATVHQRKGSGANAARQEKSHVHTSNYHAGSSRLWIADLGTDEIVGYKVAGGKVDFADSIGIKTAPGSGPRHLAFHSSMPLLYAVYELTGQVAVWDYSQPTPTLLQTVKTDTISASPGSADIHFSPDGKFVYVSNRIDANNITVLKVNDEGLLTTVGHFSTQGIKPRNFMVKEKWILAANETSGNIVVFSRSPSSGLAEKAVAEVKLPKPVCLIDLQ